ncbi:MAG TPA: hypothetical protein V6C72_08970, partial [Chroococcales cyanobacterium]
MMAVLLGACTVISGLPPAAGAQDQATPPIRMPARRAPVTVDPSKQPELGDQFPHSDMSFVQVTPQTLPVRIQRQAPKQVDQLTQNLFVVLTHTSDDSMVEIYRKNRLGGQLGNFVTVDSIAHPYLGFYNWVCGRAIETHIAHDL